MQRAALLLFLLVGLQACGPTLSPFTLRLYEENRWTDSELKRIQFYLSQDVVLTRSIGGNASEITSGEVRVINGRKVEQVIIPRGTPGVFLFSPKENRFAVSFEDGADQRYLMFGPNPKVGNRFVLLARDWDRRSGAVTYDGQLWRLEGEDAFATLLVNLKKINRTIVQTRRAKGRQVDGK